MAVVVRTVELARTLRSQAGLRTRQPLARLWLALPIGTALVDWQVALLEDEINVKAVRLIHDESELVERRVKPLLPKIGRKLGGAIPAVMAAARAGAFEIHPDGTVTMGGVTLAADEVEILAAPRPGTAVAHDDGLVVVIDTELTPALRAEGDARELQRAIQDLRRDAGLELDESVDVEVGPASVLERLRPFLDSIQRETIAESIVAAATSAGELLAHVAPVASAVVTLANEAVSVVLRKARERRP